MIEMTRDNVQIYVETLMALARDAHARGNREALKFVGGYLVNLVPEHRLESFRDELRRSSKVDVDGGTTIVAPSSPLPIRPVDGAAVSITF